jgi:cytochrome c-type biogenesis protein
VADAALLSFHFSLGLLAFFSPCGFPMLPAYLAYYLPQTGEAPERGVRAALRGLAGGGVAAAGALAVLLAIGGAAAWIGAPFKERVLLLELVGGLIVITLGALTLAGRGPSFKVGIRPSRSRGALGLFGFGALYAAVAAGCVAPLFLGVLFSALAAPTVLDGVLLVGAYALGLAGLLVVVTVLITTAQETVVRSLKRVLPHVERVSGAVLVVVGAYLVYYWARVEGYV